MSAPSADRVLDALDSGPMSVGNLAAQIGCTTSDARRSLLRLRHHVIREVTGGVERYRRADSEEAR